MTPPSRATLQREAEPPAGTRAPATVRREETDKGRVLACARCLAPVTTPSARIEVAGSHDHTFTNPAGQRFRIGCFAMAEGCVPVGDESSYWTWFPPCRWQIELCASCMEHLGWLFRSRDTLFHGLILERLVEREANG